MKKIIVVLVALLLGGAAFGEDLKVSAGVLAAYTASSESFTMEGDFMGSSIKETLELSDAFLGFGAFVDTKYVAGEVSYMIQSGDMKMVDTTTIDGSASTTNDSATTEFSKVSLRVHGKYPFEFGKVTVFPLAGFAYLATLNFKDKDLYTDDYIKDLNDFFIDLGVGADFDMTETIFLRTQAVFGLNVTPLQAALSDVMAAIAESNGFKHSLFGYNLDISCGVGFRF